MTTDNPAINCTVSRSHCRRQAFVEIVLIFAVFAIQGAWPVPDVNEPHYLGKAIHFWNPDWLRGDFFMESPDTHKVFCSRFGWLSLWLSPVALAWTGRILTLGSAGLGVAAAEFRRRAAAVVVGAHGRAVRLLDGTLPHGRRMGHRRRRGQAIRLCVRASWASNRWCANRWNRALLLFGAASAFHVMVGGWAAVAAGIAWFVVRVQGSGFGVEGSGFGVQGSDVVDAPSAFRLPPSAFRLRPPPSAFRLPPSAFRSALAFPGASGRSGRAFSADCCFRCRG